MEEYGHDEPEPLIGDRALIDRLAEIGIRDWGEATQLGQFALRGLVSGVGARPVEWLAGIGDIICKAHARREAGTHVYENVG